MSSGFRIKRLANTSIRRRPRPRVPASIVVVEREPDFESDLIMRNLAVFDMAARLHHFEPANLPQRARRTADGVLNRVLDALLRGPCDLDDPVNMIRHRHSPLARPGRPGGSVRLSESVCGLTLVPLRPYLMQDRPSVLSPHAADDKKPGKRPRLGPHADLVRTCRVGRIGLPR